MMPVLGYFEKCNPRLDSQPQDRRQVTAIYLKDTAAANHEAVGE
jgi:hypothetical protein